MRDVGGEVPTDGFGIMKGAAAAVAHRG
jgi:hypothetical protein